jgi:hypothetical protein
VERIWQEGKVINVTAFSVQVPTARRLLLLKDVESSVTSIPVEALLVSVRIDMQAISLGSAIEPLYIADRREDKEDKKDSCLREI